MYACSHFAVLEHNFNVHVNIFELERNAIKLSSWKTNTTIVQSAASPSHSVLQNHSRWLVHYEVWVLQARVRRSAASSFFTCCTKCGVLFWIERRKPTDKVELTTNSHTNTHADWWQNTIYDDDDLALNLMIEYVVFLKVNLVNVFLISCHPFPTRFSLSRARALDGCLCIFQWFFWPHR